MTKLQFDSLYYGKAVHCDTKEKAEEFLALADSVGYRWFSGGSLIERSYWETYYYITNDGLVFSNMNYIRQKGYQIIEYQLPHKLKVGDKVIVKNTMFTDINGRVGIITHVDSLSPMPYFVKVGRTEWALWFYECQLEKVKESPQKEETIDDIIKEIKTKLNEIGILLNQLEKKEKGE